MNQITLTEERRIQNFELFKKKLNSIGIDSTILVEKYGNELLNGTYAFSNAESGFCGDGTLLEVVLRTLTPTAIAINNLLSEDKKVESNSLIKVCFLHQLAKSIMVEPNDNKWEIEQRGILYKYKKSKYATKLGTKSISLCLECGISFNENELEAIFNLDREDDKQIKFYSSALATVLRQAIELTEVIGRK